MQIAKHWRLKGPRYRLEGVRDPVCGSLVFPPPAQSDTWERVPLNGRGVIESFTQTGRATREVIEGTPHGVVLALVRLDDGPLVTAQLTDVDPHDVQIGMAVEMVTRKIRDLGADGLIVYGYKFRPRLEA